MLIYSQDLLPEEKRLWMDLNEPPYNAFRDSENLIKPEKETLRWLVELDDFRPKESPESGPSLSSYDFIKWRDCPQSGALVVKGAPGQGKSVLSNFVYAILRRCKKMLRHHKTARLSITSATF